MSMIAEKNEYTVLIERDEEPMNPCIEYDLMGEIADHLPDDFKNLKELLHENDHPLVTSVMKASPETKESIFEMLAQNNQRIEEATKTSPLPTRSGDAR